MTTLHVVTTSVNLNYHMLAHSWLFFYIWYNICLGSKKTFTHSRYSVRIVLAQFCVHFVFCFCFFIFFHTDVDHSPYCCYSIPLVLLSYFNVMRRLGFLFFFNINYLETLFSSWVLHFTNKLTYCENYYFSNLIFSHWSQTW